MTAERHGEPAWTRTRSGNPFGGWNGHPALGMLVNPPSFVGGVPFPFETTRALDVRAFVVGSLLVLVRSAGNVPARQAGSDP